MRVSARTGKNTRVSMSPLGWLIVGPLIVMAYLMGYMLKGAVLIIAWCVNEYSAHRARKRALAAGADPAAVTAPLPAPPTGARATHPEDAVPPGYMPRRPRS